MKIACLLLASVFGAFAYPSLADESETDDKIAYPGENYFSGPQTVPAGMVLLKTKVGTSQGYVRVEVSSSEAGNTLSLIHCSGDGKPLQDLQERTVKVHLLLDEKEEEIKMRNHFGHLFSRKALPDSTEWRLRVELKGVRSGIADDSFEVTYKKIWVSTQ